MREMRIGVLGGSYNPVHLGHVALGEALVREGYVDETWMVLTPRNPLKAHPEELVGDGERMDMLRLAVKGHKGLRASDIEMRMASEGNDGLRGRNLGTEKRKEKGENGRDREEGKGRVRATYTIDTLRELERRYPEHEFRLVIGADNWAIFRQWRNYEEIIRDFAPIVYPRPGYSEEGCAMGLPTTAISSTELREALRRGEAGLPNKYLSPEVLTYIHTHQLYQ